MSHEHDGPDWDLQQLIAERARDGFHKLVADTTDGGHQVCRGCIDVGAKAYMLAILKATAEYVPEAAAGMMPVIEMAEVALKAAVAGRRDDPGALS